MGEEKPQYESANISIFEWCYPLCEIYDKDMDSYVHIRTPEDAKALIDSLNNFLSTIPIEFGGIKNE